MKSIKFKLLIATLVSFAFILSSCKEDCPCDDPTDPTCDNYDPCFGKREVPTFFKVRPGDNGFAPPEEWCDLVQCDTFITSSVRFDIPEGSFESSTFEWQIGSEAEPRTGKAFEISFLEYLKDNGWNTWIPITLTIRTPLNLCLTNPKDTLVSVTRELFFTTKQLYLFPRKGGTNTYQGFFTNEPNKTVNLSFTLLDSTDFRGYTPPMYLITGIPHIDTLALPSKSNWTEYCGTYRQIHAKHPDYKTLMEDVSHYLYERNYLFTDGRKQVRLNLIFDPPEGRIHYSFRGKLLE